jgi:iron complex outermembrane receptor protein
LSRRRPGAGAMRSLLPLWLLCAAVGAQPGDPADLTALSLEQLLDVKIVGASKYVQKQSEVAAAVSIITRQEIQAFGWHTLAEALASLPGVYTTYDRQYSYLGMRGFGLPGDLNTRVLITINGNRVNDPTFDQAPTGPEFPVDMDMVERIEFIPGPGGAVYGQNAMLGVVNVVTRDGAAVGGVELAAAYEAPQALSEGRATGGWVFGNGVDAVVSASDMGARGEDRFYRFGASGISGVAVGMDGERNQQFFARIADGAWSLEQVYGLHRKDDPTGAFLSDPLVPGDYQGDRHSLTQLQFADSGAGDTLHVLARVFIGSENYRSSLSYDGPFLSPADSNWSGAEARLLSTALADHKLMLGLEVQDNTRENQAAVYPAKPADDVFIGVQGYRGGIYAQDEWRLTDSLAATLGAREDRNDETGDKLSPRAALIWRPASATTLKALYGIAHRAPNAFERDYGDGVTQTANLSLKGETIDTIELVADQRIASDFTLRTSVYRWTMQDLITLGLDPVTGLSQYQSGESVKAHGVEVSADKTWDPGARLRASLSAQEADYVDGHELLNSPKLLGKLNLSAPLPVRHLRAAYEFQYDSSRLTLNGTTLSGYELSNLILSTDILAPRSLLSVGVYNLFDEQYAQPGSATNWQNSFEQDGRSVQFKAAFGF